MMHHRSGLGETLSTHRANVRRVGSWQYRHELSVVDSVDRNAYLSDLVSGKRILHVGCAAEGETLRQLERGDHLYQVLERSAAIQIGVDPDEVGVAEMLSSSGAGCQIVTATLENLGDDVLESLRPEYVLIPEVIEHVTDAGAMLATARVVAERFDSEIVVTVPSALAWSGILSWFQGYEYVHPDHVSYYTPRTLQTLFEKCNLEPIEIRPYSWGRPPSPIGIVDVVRLVIRARGGLRPRALSAVTGMFSHRFPDGWIGRARPTRARVSKSKS